MPRLLHHHMASSRLPSAAAATAVPSIAVNLTSNNNNDIAPSTYSLRSPVIAEPTHLLWNFQQQHQQSPPPPLSPGPRVCNGEMVLPCEGLLDPLDWVPAAHWQEEPDGAAAVAAATAVRGQANGSPLFLTTDAVVSCAAAADGGNGVAFPGAPLLSLAIPLPRTMSPAAAVVDSPSLSLATVSAEGGSSPFFTTTTNAATTGSVAKKCVSLLPTTPPTSFRSSVRFPPPPPPCLIVPSSPFVRSQFSSNLCDDAQPQHYDPTNISLEGEGNTIFLGPSLAAQRGAPTAVSPYMDPLEWSMCDSLGCCCSTESTPQKPVLVDPENEDSSTALGLTAVGRPKPLCF